MIKHRYLFVLLIILFSITSSFLMAQKDSTIKKINMDSVLKTYFKTSDTKTLTKSDFTQRTEWAYEILDDAVNVSEISWQELAGKDQLNENRKIIRVLRKVLKRHTNSDFRNLQLYRNMLVDILNQSNNISKYLEEKKQNIITSRENIMTIPKDSILYVMIKTSLEDTTKKIRTKSLKKKWVFTETMLKENLDSVNRWISLSSQQTIMISSLLHKTDSLIQHGGLKAFNGDYPFLWKKELMDTTVVVVDTSANATTPAQDNDKIIRYYVKRNLTRILWIPVIVFILFYIWIRRKYKSLKTTSNDILEKDHYLFFIKVSRVISAVIICLNLFPLLDVHAPWFYLVINQCIMMGSVIYLFWQKDLRMLVPHAVFLLLMMIGITINNSFEPTNAQRWVLIILNILSFVSAFFLFSRIKHLPQLKKAVRLVTVVYMLVNLAAIVCNLLGRVIISEALTNSGIIGITQIIALSVFLQIISEAFYLQLLSSRVKRNMPQNTEYPTILTSLNKPIYVFILVVWVMMFTANLYTYVMMEAALLKLLTTSINIGSLSFTVGNLVLFFVIIWIAHLLQKYIGAFFGDADADGDENLENKKGRSRMMVIKLVVLCLGYLLAVGVSGLPLDKITIIIGALGVGVGMGLQNIVNNFVSGVVLIFDRPLQIGDTIEVSGSSGKVKNIGIRSSTILTDDGAEVIIPNGDILSRPITNWTLSNNQRRIILHFNLKNADRDTIIPIIHEVVKTTDGSVTEKDPVILFESLKENEMRIKIFFWCNNAGKNDWLKSEVRYLLYSKFREKGIIVM